MVMPKKKKIGRLLVLCFRWYLNNNTYFLDFKCLFNVYFKAKSKVTVKHRATETSLDSFLVSSLPPFVSAACSAAASSCKCRSAAPLPLRLLFAGNMGTRKYVSSTWSMQCLAVHTVVAGMFCELLLCCLQEVVDFGTKR